MFRFSVREMLLVMTIGSVAGAWWSDHQALAAANKQANVARERAEIMASLLLHQKHPLHSDMCNAPYICGTVGAR